METANIQEGPEATDIQVKAEKTPEQSHHENNKKQDGNQGASSSIDVENHPAFKKARKAIATFDRRASKLIREDKDYEMEIGPSSFDSIEGSLDSMDALHQKALTVVRKAIEVDKKEGDKLKATLRENWQLLRDYFAEHINELETFDLVRHCCSFPVSKT